MNWELRTELRDVRFSALADEKGAGDLDQNEVVLRLIRDLYHCLETAPDETSKEASVRLFGWIVEHEQWHFLRGYPAFSDEGPKSAIIRLDYHGKGEQERPLAPIVTWPQSLMEYADLFPRRHTLAKEFAEVVQDQDIWTTLEDHTFLRRTVLYSQKSALSVFLPDEPLLEDDGEPIEHKVKDPVSVTEVAFLTKTDIGVLSRVRQSRGQAQLFWKFLTQWLVEQDVQAFATKQSECICQSTHRYNPAAWLVPIVRNKWVPLEGRRTDRATAHSLANLIRDGDWPLDHLSNSPQVVALLSALGIGVPELILAHAARNEEERSALDQTLSSFLTSLHNDWSRLDDLANDIQDDENLFDHLAERREQRRVVRENQRLGELVETLVKAGLKEEGFKVRRTGIGSDFAIEVIHEDRVWLVEVKSTRDNCVRMTATQARTAVDRNQEFLLCVVPLGEDPVDPDIKKVRDCVRFVENIGIQLTHICEGLDNLEELRTSVTSDDDNGFRLEVESGAPRVRVDISVWSTGFTLEELFSRLAHNCCQGDTKTK